MDEPAADRNALFLQKYTDLMMTRHSWTPLDFATLYPLPVRFRPTTVRGHP